MRLYVDEDLASKELVARLEQAGHHIVPTRRGVADREAWGYAQENEAVVLTRNARDYIALAAEGPHHGLLLVHEEEDSSKSLRIAQIADAVMKVEAAFGGALEDQTASLNHYRYQ